MWVKRGNLECFDWLCEQSCFGLSTHQFLLRNFYSVLDMSETIRSKI